jgi:hypothetical protein
MKYTQNENDSSVIFGFEIPKPVAAAIASGWAQLTVTVGQRGASCRVMDLTHPWTMHETISLSDATTRFDELHARKHSVVESSDSDEDASPSSNKDSDVGGLGARLSGLASIKPWMSLRQAQERVQSKGLYQHRIAGVLNRYPDDSLVKQDFKREDIKDFQARTTCVANAIGAAKAVSRIATDSRLSVPGADNLEDWWTGATSLQKAQLLTLRKKLDVFTAKLQYERLHQIASPFREAGSGTFSD